MKRLILKPNGWKCKLEECPPGLFVYDGRVGFKSEYHNEGNTEAFCESGEYFVGGSKSQEERENLLVQPVEAEWIDDE